MRVTRCALAAHRYTGLALAAEPRTTAVFYFISVSLWNDLADPVFDGMGLECFMNIINVFLLAKATSSIFDFYWFSVSYVSLFRLV